jgi:hypothetical protein
MTTLEIITPKIEAKTAALPDGVGIVTPDNRIPPAIQSAWLISLLQGMYVNHGITKNPGRLTADISSGNCRLWFGFKDGVPVASSALVSQSDGSWELGRATSTFPGLGGLLMLLSAADHLENSSAPLVAEVRASAEFAGVPSGEATQKICLEHLGLMVHGLIPAFGHGLPFRQEQFFLASSQSFAESAPISLPDSPKVQDLFGATTLPLAKNFSPNLSVRTFSPNLNFSGWEIVQSSPFSIIVPSTSSTLDTALTQSFASAPFTMIPLEASPASVSAISDCLDHNFVPCGIDRHLGPSGHPILLFGQLAPKTPLAPTKFLPDLSSNIRRSAETINSLFKKLVE